MPLWLDDTRKRATEYLTRFAFSPGIERIMREFDVNYESMQSLSDRLAGLSEVADREWDFRKGRERFEVEANEPMDQPDSELGKIILESAEAIEMATASSATLAHYDVVAILGGANMSNYYRLHYALDQSISCNMLVFLGSERPVAEPEKLLAHDYAPDARTEFELGIGAITTLLGHQLTAYERTVQVGDGHFTVFQEQNGLPVVVLSAPALDGHARATTSDTYQFLRSIEQSSFAPGKNILFVTASMYRYAQYFDAVRDISLVTGANIETIGFAPIYSKTECKPSKLLQELKSAADAAVRLNGALREPQ